MFKRLALLWTLIRGDARVLWHALRHPGAPRWLKLGTLGLLVYLVSPIDLVPDWIPLLGVMDDVVLLPVAVRWMIKRLPAAVRAHAEAAARR